MNHITHFQNYVMISDQDDPTFVGVKIHSQLIVRKMKTAKKLGIWMDHAHAHLSEFSTGQIETNIIASEFTQQEKELSPEKDEYHIHSKGKHKQLEFYKKVSDAIRNYDDVLIFGPTDAKLELANLLKEDHLFSKINIETKQTDKMTESDQHAFITEHFNAHR